MPRRTSLFRQHWWLPSAVVAAATAAAIGGSTGAAHAQAALVGATGYIDYSTQTVGAAPGAGGAVFGADGQLVTPNGAYPTVSDNIAPPNTLIASAGPAALGLIALNSPAGAGGVAAWGGATETLFANNNGVFGTNLSLGDAGGVDAGVSYTSFSSTYTIGAGGYVGTVGSYLALVGSLPAGAAGDYLAAALTTEITATAVGGAVDTFDSDLVFGYGFNGAGAALPTILSPTASLNGVAGGTTVSNFIQLNANQFAFGETAFVGANLAPGTALTFDGTLTMIADPASFETFGGLSPSLDHELGLPDPTFGEQDNQFNAAPEPGALSLMAMVMPGGLALWRMRRRRSSAVATGV